MDWKIEFKNTIQNLETDGIQGIFDSWIWLIDSSSILLGFVFLILGAKALSDSKFSSGLIAMICSVLCCITPSLALMITY